MAYFGITANEAGLQAAAPGEDMEAGLRRRLGGGQTSPVVILVHGYKFDPARPEADPHRSLYAFRPEADCWKVRSWPAGLGFADDAGETGLCIGFGWPADLPPLHILRSGRTGFAAVYERAAGYGLRLAELVALVQRLAPGRPVDILAHSLGARLALGALPRMDRRPGRIVLLGAAEFESRTHEALGAMTVAAPEIYNVTCRANDLYDLMFETFAPGRSRGERAIGLGLRHRPPHWLDLQIDRRQVTAWINARGIPLAASGARLCHWDFYTRDGAMAVYQAILRRRPGWDVASLRAVPGLADQQPRWSRLLPLPRLPGPDDGLELGGGIAFE